MTVSVVTGCQWGDEGKGKIVDVLAKESDIVARFQGGANAGHTIYHGDKKYVLHNIPSGAVCPGVINVIGAGVVLDPIGLMEEVDALENQNIEVMSRLKIAEQAHLILPGHKALDKARELASGKNLIGTTLRGIGLAYADKALRCGIRACDLLHVDKFVKAYRALSLRQKELLDTLKAVDIPNFEVELEKLLEIAGRYKPLIQDTSAYLNNAIHNNKEIVCEGAQGVMLDIDHGTYPFVTSSNPTPSGACVSLGIAPKHIKRVIGVVKAYTTRVGSGPLPTELFGEEGENLQNRGGEFGATTGRPRRCGWLDLPVLRRSVMLCGCTELAVTKLDILDNYDEIPICDKYVKDEHIEEKMIPYDYEVVKTCKPNYVKLNGWKKDTSEIRKFEDLPDNVLNYLRFIEKEVSTPVKIASVGPSQAATIFES